MKSLFRYIIFLILLNFSFAAKAESVYPIQLYAAMLPPYTNCLGDYINGDMNRLKLSAVVRDMTKHGSTMSISVLMRVKSGNTVYLETTTPVQQIINVQGAMVDIRTENLFTSYDNNAKNLVGRGSFMSNGYCLPEGAYEFVYQVFDGTNKKLPLSEPISIYCFLNQAEPPVGVTPLDGECLDSKTNQNIVFSWMDAVAIGPKYREYSVEVMEQNGTMLASQTGLLPMFGAQSEVNNFTVVTEKSYNTNTLIMQNTSGKFQEGKTYLWRVKAVPTKVKGKADENLAYKNNGCSEWMSFKYGGCGDTVVIPKADSIDMNLLVDMTTVDTQEETGSVVVHWEDIFKNTEVDKYCAYELYIYKADNEAAAKTLIPIKDGETKEYTFENLERGETYKSYIVGLTGCGTPDTIRTPHSDTVSFSLKKPESDDCKVNIDPAKCGKDNLLEKLEKGNTFTVNDHDVIVTVTECEAGTEAGSFSGKGIVSCTIFKDKIGLNVEFKNILVNKSKELCRDTVKVITSDENNLLINLNDLTGKKRTAPKAPSQDYPYTKKVATLEELQKNVEQYKGEVVLVGDKEIYAVGNDGEIEEVGKIVENACRPSKQSLDNSAGLVVFDVDEKYNEGKWTPYIDKSPSPFSYAQIVNGYERIGSYVVPWVSMVQGEARYIKATIQGKTKTTGTGLSGMEKDIKFYCVTDSVMTELNSEYKDGAFKVKVFGGQPDRKLTIVAMMNSTGTADECAKNSKTIGETNIYTMSYRKKTIHLVPVCMDVTGEMGDPKTYADRINKVFAPLGRSYEFKLENKFENDAVKSLIANGLNTEDGGNVFNNKTPEMKQLCRLYKHDENVKIDHRADAYVFLLDKNTNSKIKGYMPRTNSEGFVFTEDMNVDQIAETMTHELCHGLYGLEHTFKYGVDENAVPENIMSYSTQIGRTPSKYFQWYNIENPSEYHFPFTDSAEDGEWTTDGHYYLFTYVGMLMGLDYEEAEKYGRYAEKPDTYVLSKEDVNKGYVYMGNNVKVSLQIPVGYTLNGLYFAKPNEKYTCYRGVSKEGYVFMLTNNCTDYVQKGAITLNEEDIKKGKKVIGTDKKNKPIELSFKNHKEGDMLENTTWMVGGLQQRNHALTGGLHGVELAATAYAIKHKAKSDLNFTEDFSQYLLHRFGDDFAHFDISHDKEKLDPIPLTDYIDAFDEYFRYNIHENSYSISYWEGENNVNVEFEKDQIYYFEQENAFYSTLSKNEIKAGIIRSLLFADSRIRRVGVVSDSKLEKVVNEIISKRDIWDAIYGTADYFLKLKTSKQIKIMASLLCPIENAIYIDDLIDESVEEAKENKKRLKDYFASYLTNSELHNIFLDQLTEYGAKATQNKFVMYGDQVTCVSGLTGGHAKDRSQPDEIVLRPNLFMFYVNKVIELYPILTQDEGKKVDISQAQNAYNEIKLIVDWAVQTYENLSEDEREDIIFKLDGVFRFLIEAKRHEKDGYFTISIPIKCLAKELNKGFAKAWYKYDTAFDVSANEAGKRMADYIQSKYNYTLYPLGNVNDEEILFYVFKKNNAK